MLAFESNWQKCNTNVTCNAPRPRQVTTPASHNSTLQSRCPSCHLTNSIKATHKCVIIREHACVITEWKPEHFFDVAVLLSKCEDVYTADLPLLLQVNKYAVCPRCCSSVTFINSFITTKLPLIIYEYILQCFDAVGWASGRASGL